MEIPLANPRRFTANHFGDGSIKVIQQKAPHRPIGPPEIGGSPIAFRQPRPTDGTAVAQLIAACPPLDPNSTYCNLLQCTYFAQTCIVAERGTELAGWISGFRPPQAATELFIWQVAVAPWARGKGLGGLMLDRLTAHCAGRGVVSLATTITEENGPSWALFRAFARRHQAPFVRRPLFERTTHFAGAHATEHLVSIGPLAGQPAGNDTYQNE
jgi:L-2,4-diaminobutyric acid acetyltransferase